MNIEKGPQLIPESRRSLPQSEYEGREKFAEGLYVSWEVAPKCDLACPHCYALNEETGSELREAEDQEKQFELVTKSWMEEMPLSEISKGLDNLERVGVQDFNIEGGEPTLRKDIVDIVKAAKARGFRAHLSTHGMHLLRTDKETGKPLAEQLREAGLDTMAISIDSADEETNNRIRQKCSGEPSEHYSKAINFLQWYGKRWQETMENGEHMYRLKINTSVTRFNIDTASDVASLVRQHIPKEAYSQLKIVQFHPRGKGAEKEEELGISGDEFAWVVQEAKDKASDNLEVTARPYKDEVYPFVVIGFRGTAVIPEGKEQKPMKVIGDDGRTEVINVRKENFYDLFKRYVKEHPSFVTENRKINTYINE